MALVRGLLTPTPDGIETEFEIAHTLISGSEAVFRNGISQHVITGGSPIAGQVKIVGTTVTFNAAPQSGERLHYMGDEVV